VQVLVGPWEEKVHAMSGSHLETLNSQYDFAGVWLAEHIAWRSSQSVCAREARNIQQVRLQISLVAA
jgi:hypothetical protein